MTAWDRLPLDYRAGLERRAANVALAKQKIIEWRRAHPARHAQRGPVEGCPQPESPWRPRG